MHFCIENWVLAFWLVLIGGLYNIVVDIFCIICIAPINHGGAYHLDKSVVFNKALQMGNN